jgi:methyl-accepting chemotaxis protein
MDLGTWLAISLLLQDQGVGVRDTVVMIAAERGFMETLAVTGQFVVSLVVLVLLGAVVFVLLALRKSVQDLTKLLNASSGDISAAAHSVRHVAEDVRGITQSVKTDVGAVSDTIRHVNKGVRRAVRRAEARLQRLDALVSVAQEEAEEFVMSSASTLRGVRLGASALKRSFLSARRRGIKRKKRRPFRERRRERERDEDDGMSERGTERPRIRTRVVDPS